MILACRTILGTEDFEAWGWRIPFLLSILLLIISVYIRLQLSESPVFLKMKEEGKSSKAPLTESFARWENLKIVIMALLGGTAGQAVVWYTGQFYALFFLLQTLKIDPQTANYLIAGSLLIGTPFFIVFGSLSDRIGRKGIIMAGCILAALTYFPIFHALTQYGNPDVFAAQEKNPVTELFPARIRYTSMSLPYHIGNGWFGGFLPSVAFAMVAATGDIYYGLWYPIVIAVMTAILGTFFLPETKDREIHHT